jgi:uncharacterized protein (TIGR02594 family)
MSDIATIQQALRTAGYDPGPIDGIWGRRSVRACRDYQAAHGLTPDGVCGPLTLAALFPAGAPAVPLPWFSEAQRLVGTREAPGGANNPVILDWASDLGIPYTGDDVPWCGLFVSHCLGATLPDEPLPASPLWARAWLGFGRRVTPRVGAVLVFWRGKRTGTQGHVGFYAAEDASAYHVLGGNQGDRVSVARISKTRLLGATWPTTAPTVQQTQQATATGALSTNES